MKPKKLLFIVCTVLFCTTTIKAQGIIDSGNCGANGDNLTWQLTDGGTLTISGEGEMADFTGDFTYDCFAPPEECEYPYHNPSPWYYESWQIKNVIIENGVTTIGSCAFYGCEAITLNIGNTVNSMHDETFANCTFTAINVDADNQNFSSIDGILYNKSQDTLMLCPQGIQGAVIIPNTVVLIEDYAFADCENVTNVIIPNSVKTIGAGAFYYSGLSGTLIIPNTITSIGNSAFYNCRQLTTVIIGNSITSIENWTFGHCINLTEVSIPNSVVSIGNDVFVGCSNLKEITIPKSVLSIKGDISGNGLEAINVDGENPNYSSVDGVLYNKLQDTLIRCPSKKQGTLIIPNTVISIEKLSFLGSSITSVVIPNSVKTIEEKAFQFSSLSGALIIPNTVTSMGNSAFFNCKQLTSVVIGDSITSIDSWTFGHCINLTEVNIPNSVVSIGYYAFSGCNNLKEITIPKSVLSVGRFGNNSLETIYVDADNPNYSSTDGILYNKLQDTLICCPEKKRGAIIIPNTVKTIEENAFYHCIYLTTVTIPNSVTSIKNYAFADFKFTDVYVSWTIPPNIDFNVFNSWYLQNVKLHIPKSALSIYQNAPVWQNFQLVATETGIEEKRISAVEIYPNPVLESFYLSNLTENTFVTISDISGKIVLQQMVSPNENISAGHLSSGIYFVNVKGKIVKMIKK